MKGLVAIPQNEDLATAYERFQFADGNRDVSANELARWSQWTRFDPRLGQLWIHWISKHWKTISPLAFQEQIKTQPWPAVVGVLLEQVLEVLPVEEKALFHKWMTVVLHNIPPAQNELFFIGLFRFAGKRITQDVLRSSRPYRNWGFFGTDWMLEKKVPLKTSLSRPQRLVLLNQLIRSEPRFTVEDYRKFLGDLVGRRQAERDLKGHPGLKAVGQTRNRFYRKK